MIEFVIPIQVTGALGLNSIYSNNKHWATRKKEAEEIHDCVKYAMLSQRVEKHIINCPVEINIFYNSKLDIDNHGYIAKLLIDGLKGYLLEDDSPKFVRKLTQSYYSGKGIKIKIDRFIGWQDEM